MRKAIGKRLRFEVLKRDGFRCRYCGATAMQVLLQVDHVVPESRGGATKAENLVTACEDCNAGKSALEILPPLPKNEPYRLAWEEVSRWIRLMNFAGNLDPRAELGTLDADLEIFVHEFGHIEWRLEQRKAGEWVYDGETADNRGRFCEPDGSPPWGDA